MKRKSVLRYIVFGFMVLSLLIGSSGLVGAANIPINSIDGNWANPVGGENVAISADGSTASWGEPTWYYSPARSSYVFSSTATPFNALSDGTPFTLGTFTHNNFPIPSGSGITSIQLLFSLGIDGLAPFTATFNISHNETPNTNDPLASRDIVTLANLILNEYFFYDSDGNGTAEKYYFNLIGFVPVGSSTPSSVFYTYENMSNTAYLKGMITEVPVTTPEPFSLLLLGLGLVGLAGFRKRS